MKNTYKVNVYDFDKTIFDGDSTQKFYIFLLKKYPKILKYLPKQFIFFIPFSIKFLPKTVFKEKFYTCFKCIDNINKEVDIFWQHNIDNIKDWYYKNQKETDIIISASPEFLLRPICDKIGIKNLIASKVDSKTGKYDGLNCYGKEKVKRFKEKYPNLLIGEFYSDSFSDQPLADIAESSYLVLGNDLFVWDEYIKGNKILKN